MAYLAPSLSALREQVNAKWSNRSKGSDGWIGDRAHASRKSDHNPDGKGCVHALDITADGVDVQQIISTAQADPRVKYWIYNGRIWVRGQGISTYRGPNPHRTHVHISVYSGPGEDGHPWNLSSTPAGKTIPKVTVDNYWGAVTQNVLAIIFDTTPDGVVSGQSRKWKHAPAFRVGSGGSELIRRWQTNWGMTPTGVCDGPTIRKMQEWLGVEQDESIGPITVRKMQEWINRQ